MGVNSTDEKQAAASSSLRDWGVPFALGAVYLLCAMRYFPGRPVDTLIATLEHLLASVPFSFGFTLLVVSVLARVSGQKPSRLFMVRLFFTFAILGELLFGLYHYLSVG